MNGIQIAPHVSQQARDAIDDLGIVDDDNTPDMRKAPAATEALQNDHRAVTTTTKEI